MLASVLSLLICLFLGPAHAQFQFFEQMFQGGGQQQQHQQPQNVASDSQWYQQTYESGRIRLSISSVIIKFLSQLIATTTYVQEHWLVFTSLIIAHVLGLPWKTKSNWGKEVQSVFQKEDTKLGRLQERLNWRERGFFEATAKQDL